MLDKSSNASRLVDRLEEKGYVKKAVNHKDKRAVDVIITDAGLAALGRIDKDPEVLSGHLSNLSEKEAAQLNQLLDKLRG